MPGPLGRCPGPLDPGWPGRDGHREPPGSTAGLLPARRGQRGTQGCNIHGINSLSRGSNAERNNKALSVIKLISSWIGKVWQCLGGCGRPLWLELEHPQKSTSGQQWKTRICPGRFSLFFPVICRWSYSPLSAVPLPALPSFPGERNQDAPQGKDPCPGHLMEH